MNRLAYLLAGMAIGAVGMAIAKESKECNGGPGLKAVVQGGHNIVEKVMGAAETLKEDVEDYLAEAKYAREENLSQEESSPLTKEDVEVDATTTFESEVEGTVKEDSKN